MQLSRLPSAPPNLLADPLGIMSQENKDNKPGESVSQLWGFAPKVSASCLEVSPALPMGFARTLWDGVRYFP